MDAEWAKAVADLDGALTEDAVTSALRDMHRLLSLNPELRATVRDWLPAAMHPHAASVRTMPVLQSS